MPPVIVCSPVPTHHRDRLIAQGADDRTRDERARTLHGPIVVRRTCHHYFTLVFAIRVDGDFIGFRVVRPVEEQDDLKGLRPLVRWESK